jgi:hypothetical protein
MTISLDDLIRLAGADPAQFRRLTKLARRLNVLERERASIMAQLVEFGVAEQVAPPQHVISTPIPRPSTDPPCAVCGKDSVMDVDGRWLCELHAEEAVIR